MNFVIISKNPFSHGDWRPYFTGHTLGFAGPLTHYLVGAGHKVAMISPWIESDPIETDLNVHLPPPQSGRFVQLAISPADLPKVPFSLFQLDTQAAIREAAGILGSVDVICVVWVFPYVMAALNMREELNCPVAAFLRGSDLNNCCDPHSYYRDLYGDRWSHVTAEFRRSLNQADRIYGVSDWQRTHANNLGIRVDSLAPAPAFPSRVDLAPLEQGDAETKRRFLSEHEPPVKLEKMPPAENHWIVFAGRLSFEKRPELALESVRRLGRQTSVSLIFAGEGPMEDELRKTSAESGVDSHFLGPVDPDLVPLLCRSARVMIHPVFPSDRFTDARPGSVTNAGYVGCPVILPVGDSTGGAQESVGATNLETLGIEFTGESLLADEIATRLELMLNDSGLWREIVTENQTATADFSPENVFGRLENELAELANRNPTQHLRTSG